MTDKEWDENDGYTEILRKTNNAKRRGDPIGPMFTAYLVGLKIEHAIMQFDTYFDPHEMHILDEHGMSRSLIRKLSGIHPAFISIVQETCSSFAAFSGWFVMKGVLPRDWKSRRDEIDANNPLRAHLLEHIARRIMHCGKHHGTYILEWYGEQTRRWWKRIRGFVTMQSIVKYWVHSANKPGSAGYKSGLQYIHDM